jgi:1,4-dihydroxy-2-naphthoate octaprenyltransferase
VLAGAQWKPLQAFLALFVSIALQIAVNYSNDYSDGIRGTDDNRVGPIRITASKLAPAESVKRAAIISFALASQSESLQLPPHGATQVEKTLTDIRDWARFQSLYSSV